MAKSISTTNASRFHNLSDEALADQLGDIDLRIKALEAEAKALKDELKARGNAEVQSDRFTVTVTEQIAGRLDTKAVKAFLGESYSKFEMAVVSTVVRIKPSLRVALAA